MEPTTPATQAVQSLVPFDTSITPDRAATRDIQGTRLLGQITTYLRNTESLIADRPDLVSLSRAIKATIHGVVANPMDILQAYGTWTGEFDGDGHFIWRGPLNRNGVPIMHHWYDDTGHHKDVPVHRILWPFCHSEALAGRPRKKLSCDIPTCASPNCYELSVEIQIAGRPDMSRSMRVRRAAGGVRRPVYHGETLVRVEGGNPIPVCPSCREPLGFPLSEVPDRIGTQVYCPRCEAEDAEIRTAQGLAGPPTGVRRGKVLYTNPAGESKWIREEAYRAIVKDPFDMRNPALPEADDVDEDALYAMFDKPADGVDNAT